MVTHVKNLNDSTIFIRRGRSKYESRPYFKYINNIHVKIYIVYSFKKYYIGNLVYIYESTIHRVTQ